MTRESSSNVPSAARSEPIEGSQRSKPDALAPGLYLVATPIGNLRDITLRALDTLRQADAIVCEDTRVTRKLLAAHGLDNALVSYHEHNATRMRPKLLARLAADEALALVSDAGTPLISDPGFKLVQAAAEAGHAVRALPGPSALLAGLVVSGLPSDRFTFLGFLPPKTGARRNALKGLRTLEGTLIFLESARRLPGTLEDMAAVLGSRPAAVARELTKLHEEVRRDRLDALAEHYRTAGAPKGEVVLLVGPADAAAEDPSERLDDILAEALRDHSLRDAVAAATEATGLPRRQVYARALSLSTAPSEPNDP